LLASLVSSPYELMQAAVKAYAPLVEEGVLAGVHFEGPYLSELRCGAQNPKFLRDPSTRELTELIDIGGGTVRMVTLAPERPGALEAIDLLVRHGIVAAIGHTDATHEQTVAGVAAGATVGTHVFNGMRPPHHRQPGPVFALLAAPSVVCEFVPDGAHLHDATLQFATSVTGADRAALVTDALSAAGMPDGGYDLGELSVDVVDGVARLAGSRSIAGSTLTMAAGLRRAGRTPEAARGVLPGGLGAHPRGPGHAGAAGAARHAAVGARGEGTARVRGGRPQAAGHQAALPEAHPRDAGRTARRPGADFLAGDA